MTSSGQLESHVCRLLISLHCLTGHFWFVYRILRSREEFKVPQIDPITYLAITMIIAA